MTARENNENVSRLRDVEAEFINPFISAIYETMRGMGETTAVKGVPSLHRVKCFSCDTTIVMKVEGTIVGLVVVEMDDETTRRLVSAFLLGVPIIEMDEMAKNSIMEFTLRLCDRARKLLITSEYHANVSHKVNFKTNIDLAREHEFIRVPYTLEYGQMTVYFSVMKSKLGRK